MSKQSAEQQQAVGRVMHEFAHGELESGSGRKVKSTRQAIAIGLSEAGASNRQSPAENKRKRIAAKQRVGGKSGKARRTGKD
jgi:hypothetical protein